MATWWLRVPTRLEILLLVQEHNKLRPAPNQQIAVAVTPEEAFTIQILKQEHDAARQNYNTVQRQAYRLREYIDQVLKFDARTVQNEYDHDACIAVTWEFLRRLEREKRAAEAAEEAALEAQLLDEEQREVIQRGRNREPRERHPRSKTQREDEVEDVSNITSRSQPGKEDRSKAAQENHDDPQYKRHGARKEEQQLQVRDGNIKLRIPTITLSQPCRDISTIPDNLTPTRNISKDGFNSTQEREVRHQRSAESLKAYASFPKDKKSILKVPTERKKALRGLGVSRSNILKYMPGLSSEMELLAQPLVEGVGERQRKTEILLKEAHRRALKTHQEVRKYSWRERVSD